MHPWVCGSLSEVQQLTTRGREGRGRAWACWLHLSAQGGRTQRLGPLGGFQRRLLKEAGPAAGEQAAVKVIQRPVQCRPRRDTVQRGSDAPSWAPTLCPTQTQTHRAGEELWSPGDCGRLFPAS